MRPPPHRSSCPSSSPPAPPQPCGSITQTTSSLVSSVPQPCHPENEPTCSARLKTLQPRDHHPLPTGAHPAGLPPPAPPHHACRCPLLTGSFPPPLSFLHCTPLATLSVYFLLLGKAWGLQIRLEDPWVKFRGSVDVFGKTAPLCFPSSSVEM